METMNSNNMSPNFPIIPSIWKRIVAGIIDLICIAVIMATLLVIGALIIRLTDIPFFESNYLYLLDKLADYPNDTQLFDYSWIVASLLYITFPYSFFNNTLGKHILGLKVVHLSGKEVSRWLLPYRFTPFILFLNLVLIFIDFIILLFNKNHRAVHDYIFNTIVVNKNSNYQEVLVKFEK